MEMIAPEVLSLQHKTGFFSVLKLILQKLFVQIRECMFDFKKIGLVSARDLFSYEVKY